MNNAEPLSFPHAIPSALLHFAYWPAQTPAAMVPRKNRKPKLVIAEDDDLIRQLLSVKLTAMGYSVRSAENGEAAWQSLLAGPFDLLITDFDMPELNGLDLLRRMRGASMMQPAIFISGNMPDVDPELKRLLLPGAAIAKPFTFSELTPAMEVLLNPPANRTRACAVKGKSG